MRLNIFLVLAWFCAIIAFLVEEFAKPQEFIFTVAGWLILVVIFYIASLLFGNATVGRPSNQ